jgi:hypothetical protein
MSQTDSKQTETAQNQGNSEWPKRFPPGESVPSELREDDSVFILEDEPNEEEKLDDECGYTPALVAHHREHSPATWVCLIGARRDDLSDSFKNDISESIMSSAFHADEPVASVSWFREDEVMLDTEDDGQITPEDIQSTLKVLEAFREDCRQEMMIGEARQANEAHNLIQEHQDRLVGLQEGESTNE